MTMTCDSTRWRRIAAGHYQRGLWSVLGLQKREWWLFKSGQLWGHWKPLRGWKVYQPFKTLKEARGAVEREIPHSLAC
jgi:hypothetical protein